VTVPFFHMEGEAPSCSLPADLGMPVVPVGASTAILLNCSAALCAADASRSDARQLCHTESQTRPVAVRATPRKPMANIVVRIFFPWKEQTKNGLKRRNGTFQRQKRAAFRLTFARWKRLFGVVCRQEWKRSSAVVSASRRRFCVDRDDVVQHKRHDYARLQL
jgi:hypothetical protein